jgi:hypothetical protein
VTRSVAVFDIDGVVADVRHRLHVIAGSPTHAEWVAFFDAAQGDTVLDEGRELALKLARDHDLTWVTGRPERIRHLTERWLQTNGLPSGPLFMQPPGDRRPAALVKLERLRELRQEREIALVVDDDPRVIRLLEDNDFPTRLATWLPWTPQSEL